MCAIQAHTFLKKNSSVLMEQNLIHFLEEYRVSTFPYSVFGFGFHFGRLAGSARLSGKKGHVLLSIIKNVL